MPRNVYHEINLHIVWRTKDSSAVLTDQFESRCHACIKHRAVQSSSVFVHEIGGMPDHVHMAVSVPPTLLLSEWIGQLKGASSRHINHEIANRKILYWQDGYGIVSFGTRDLPWVIEYIRNQKAHHASRGVHDRLERITQLDIPEGGGEKPVETGS